MRVKPMRSIVLRGAGSHSPRRQLVVLAVELLLALAAAWTLWVSMAPVELGGRTSYVVTDGTSMLPAYRAEGLVLTRRSDDYGVGDVVAYHDRDLGAVVMHRVIGRDGDRYVLKGDNNDFVDRYHPAQGDLLGKEWLYWPGVGGYVADLQRPPVFAAVVGLVALVALWGQSSNRRRWRHHAR
jgi:signal peptidase